MDYKVILPDASEKYFDQPVTGLELAQSISSQFAKSAVGLRYTDSQEILDLRTQIPNETQTHIVTLKDESSREVIRHSAAHILAQAVQSLWPKTQVTIGPVIEDGFFYDFDSEHVFVPEDLPVIEKKMKEIIKKNFEITKKVLPRDEAIKLFKDMGETYKIELIEAIDESESVSVYSQDGWLDLCRGPHLQKTGQVKAFKLTSISGCYWRGDENNKALQRIYGTAFESKEALAEHLHLLEEAKKRDHRKLGKELNLFHFHPLSPGAPFFSPKGATVYRRLQNYIRDKYKKYNYDEVITPQIFDVDLYHQSGHYENYRENMYFTETESRSFSVKPMNCPGHCLWYGSDKRSYRDLPIRIADFGRLHRCERSGTMHGLTRVRSFCQDDAHIFCTQDQLMSEIGEFMTMLNEIYTELGMSDYKIYLSTRPEKRMGADETWDQSEQALESALKSLNLEYTVNEGDGAFYGPKLDIMFVDALKRPWQLGTLQCDFNLPKAFELEYVGMDNTNHRPVMLHRAVLGSLERFIGVYLEHTAGRLPLWLSPNAVKILPVSDRHIEFSQTIFKVLEEAKIDVSLDDRSEKLGYKIRQAQLEQIPYMMIVGDEEVGGTEVSVRHRSGATQKMIMKAFLELLDLEKSQRRLQSTLQLD